MERDYSPKGVHFYYLYKALAHPEHNLYVKPFSMDERLMHVREAERTLGSRIPWLADTMSNAVKHALGGVPNADLIFDPEGRIAARHARWRCLATGYHRWHRGYQLAGRQRQRNRFRGPAGDQTQEAQ